MRKIFSLLALIIFCASPSIAQWSNSAAVNNSICSLAGEQAIPKIATCPNGNSYIGFFSMENGNYAVRLQRLDAEGNEMWAGGGLLISEHPSMSWLTDWDMAADINNHCVLTWQDTRNAGNNNTVAYRISPIGDFVWGNDGIALSNSTAFDAAPKVICTPAGNAVFAWTADEVIIMQKINAAGTKQWGADGITLSSTNRLSWPQLMPVGNDDVILKYFDDSGMPNAPTRHVFAQRFSSSGTPVWTNATTISNAGGISAWTQIFPFISDGNDGFYIAWHDDRDNNSLASVWIQHINASGVAQFGSNGVEVSTAAGFNHYYPQLALPQGSQEVFVFWNEMNGMQSLTGIFGQKISASGSLLWGNSGKTFLPLSGTTVTPIAARNAAEDVIVAYEEAYTVTNGQIKAMRLATDGSYVWPGNQVVVSSVSSSKVHIDMNKLQNNQWILAWEDNRNGTLDIYAQNLAIDGTLGFFDPQFGNIQGNVYLDGGNGNVTQVVISAGNASTYPNPTGYYFLEVPAGTYTVSANLSGYYPASSQGVLVLPDQSTTGADFLLEPIPTTGFIEGTISLSDGIGDVTQAIVSAGTSFTNPGENGFYSLETPVGIWEVEAALAGYTTLTKPNILVNPGVVTPNVNFILDPAPTTGILQGTVTITGGITDITQTSVTAGGQTVHPQQNGFYFMELEAGNYTVTATHPYTNTQTIDNVAITAGLSTSNIDFLLTLQRTDLVCLSVDSFGYPIPGTSVSITGPDDVYEGIFIGDTLIFENVPFGWYSGTATLDWNGAWAEADTLIDASNQVIEFMFQLWGVKHPPLDVKLNVRPNPANENSVLTMDQTSSANYKISLFESGGKLISTFDTGWLEAGHYEWPLTDLIGIRKLQAGVYVLVGELNGKKAALKIVVN